MECPAPERSAVAAWLDAVALEERGYKRCEHCEGLLPLEVSRCRRRRCPDYAPTWARDTMRKIRENLRTYGGLVAMCTLTAPGEDLGLVWDREQCRHRPGVRCSGRKFGCKVLPAAAELWNGESRGWWRELNRRAKQRADRAVRRLGHDYKGGLLMYEWELQKRGVWHLHFVLGMQTAVERAWAFEYVAALRDLGPAWCFGFVDAKPLHSPQPAERASGYLSKYLAKWRDDGSMEVTETVLAAGRTLLNYVSRKLTAESGITMRILRDVRLAWAWREGFIPADDLDPFDLMRALCLLERFSAPPRAP
jgi:hypothetical protein